MNNNHQELARMKDNIVVKEEEVERPIMGLLNNLVNSSSLGSYLEKKLHALGLKEETEVREADKIIVTIRQVVLLSVQQSELVKLSKFGYKSGHIGVYFH